MKATFRWRHIGELFTLVGWDDVLVRDDLPFEYTNAPGPKLWYVPPESWGNVAYPEHIRLGVIDENGSGYVRLMIGSVILAEDYDKLMVYLKSAAARLSLMLVELESAEEITVEV